MLRSRSWIWMRSEKRKFRNTTMQLKPCWQSTHASPCTFSMASPEDGDDGDDLLLSHEIAEWLHDVESRSSGPTLVSGGAAGADFVWCTSALRLGLAVDIWSFKEYRRKLSAGSASATRQCTVLHHSRYRV
eukprot:m.44662 g.44662  ORF g.44662 m.44662 type:complete len:131 (-) comp6207_c0_seq1:1402-1794(-)